ncbi:hypothetical protein GCM10009843_35040 [Nocardioides bigeumensis]|uniref:Uncharacterized protein n=1 Tax=Nocardioides bigeumensis TaxID=433657 RepID=A0ABP5KKE4_9ACTN
MTALDTVCRETPASSATSASVGGDTGIVPSESGSSAVRLMHPSPPGPLSRALDRSNSRYKGLSDHGYTSTEVAAPVPEGPRRPGTRGEARRAPVVGGLA